MFRPKAAGSGGKGSARLISSSVSLSSASEPDDFAISNESTWPSRLLERSELEKLLADALQKMPHVERTVLSLYYHEELTLREIAKVVNLHESRVSQLKSQAIVRLRAYIEKRWPTTRGL